jgi:hypothetical protein
MKNLKTAKTTLTLMRESCHVSRISGGQAYAAPRQQLGMRRRLQRQNKRSKENTIFQLNVGIQSF